MTNIRDVIYIKELEKRLGRSLLEEEMDGNPFEVRFPDGHWETLCVPLLSFPYDLITKPEDISPDGEVKYVT